MDTASIRSRANIISTMDIRSFFKPPKNNLPPTKARDVDKSDEDVVDVSTGSSSAMPRPAQPFVPSFVREHYEIARAPAGTSSENELWTQKYAPKKTSDLVGNPQAIQNVSELSLIHI
jgi:hypothetical protein